MYDSSRLSAGGSVGSVFVWEAERRDEVKAPSATGCGESWVS